MDCVAIIPARFASTRFPGKLLSDLAGRPLIQHVVEAAERIDGIGAIVVATDDERIAAAAREAGAAVVVSDVEFASGTDRVAAAAARHPAEIIVNIQGDELVLDPGAVAAALAGFRDDGVGLGTVRAPLAEPEHFWDPNVVKVVVDAAGRALYFSRAPLPFPRPAWLQAGEELADPGAGETWRRLVATAARPANAWAHVGIYFYRPEALRRWAALPPSALEQAEGLEQLRVLEAGETMQTYLIDEALPGVNTPEDLERAHAALAARASHA
jgi:3-deoxy-manno-octulosonate cytidylyltransferase (CMP-KDO synthetase)